MTFFWTSNVFEKCKATNECQLGFDGKCELQSLADYTKQVRKEVVDDLAISLVACFSSDAEFTRDEIVDWLQKVKDQIQGETK
jgi:hypothetical protein